MAGMAMSYDEYLDFYGYHEINFNIWFNEDRETFCASEMRAIDSTHKITPRWSFLEKIFGSQVHIKIIKSHLFESPCIFRG
jgi:hypothetical protein